MLSYKLFHAIKQSPSCLHVFAVADPEVHAATPCNFIQMPLLGICLLIVIQSCFSQPRMCNFVRGIVVDRDKEGSGKKVAEHNLH